MNKKLLVVSIGEILWDFLPEGRRLGGAPANFAYHAAVQGMNACAVSAVGNDQAGQDILSALKSKKLRTEYVYTLPEHPTGTVTVELAGGIPSYTIHEQAAWDYIPFTDELAQLAKQADAVCFGTLAQRNAVSAATIRDFLNSTRPDCLKVCDVNLRGNFFSAELIDASLRHCDLLKISDEELPAAAELLGMTCSSKAFISGLTERYNLKYAVLTKGKDGSIFYDGNEFREFPVYNYGAVVDTVGCGDSFCAVFLAGLLSCRLPEEAMLNAAKVAGFVASRSGALPEIPESLIFGSL